MGVSWRRVDAVDPASDGGDSHSDGSTVVDMGAAIGSILVHIGDQLGLYKALAAGGR